MKRQKEFVWTSKMAYAIGLIATDGNLSPDGRHFDFTSNDIELVEIFKKCLNLTNKIGRKKSGYTNKIKAYRIQFGNVVLYKKLVRLGLMPNKSKILGKLKIPKKFFFDFLRGSLDGDGSITTHKDPVYKNSVRLYLRFTSASLKHVAWLQSKILKLTGVKGFIKNGIRSFDLTYAKKDSILILKKIYYQDDLPSLKRKFVLAKSFI